MTSSIAALLLSVVAAAPAPGRFARHVNVAHRSRAVVAADAQGARGRPCLPVPGRTLRAPGGPSPRWLDAR